jgi:hypothetical protein
MAKLLTKAHVADITARDSGDGTGLLHQKCSRAWGGMQWVEGWVTILGSHPKPKRHKKQTTAIAFQVQRATGTTPSKQ